MPSFIRAVIALPAMGRLYVVSSAVLAVCCAACCHINRLPEHLHGILTIDFAVSVAENPTLRFTRFESLDSGILINPGPRQGYSETRFGNVLASFGRPVLLACLVEQLPAAFNKLLRWRADDENQPADALFTLSVDEYCLTAGEAQDAAGMEWLIRVSLVDVASGETLWRDCIEQPLALPGISVLELSRMSPAQRQAVVCLAAGDLAVFLARIIAREGDPDRG
ncbi:MAG TPA: hypothetical protein VM425_20495 [Myxococcota bacterium]|nr:hypothetical protein [Myxococcota bacterium]